MGDKLELYDHATYSCGTICWCGSDSWHFDVEGKEEHKVDPGPLQFRDGQWVHAPYRVKCANCDMPVM